MEVGGKGGNLFSECGSDYFILFWHIIIVLGDSLPAHTLTFSLFIKFILVLSLIFAFALSLKFKLVITIGYLFD